MYKHRFIKPELIPTGYMSSCLEHAKETHEIPLKDFGEASNNYKVIFQELKSFVTTTMMNQLFGGEDERTRRRYFRMVKPCVFFPAVEHEQTSQLFDWLQEKSEGKVFSMGNEFILINTFRKTTNERVTSGQFR